MNLTIHRGAEQIGGNCIELLSGESRIMLDYGSPLPQINSSGEMIRQSPKSAILNIDGLYFDSKTPLNGIIISHTHQDHYGMLFEKTINPNVSVYMSAIMEDIIRLTGKMTPGHRDLKANIKPFVKNKKFTVGDFKITPYLMDHSAAESFAFLIEAEGKKVIYTGDYREHGHKANAFKQFLNTNMGKIDVLITEGTMAGVEEGKTEKIIMSEMSKLITDKTGTVYVMCSGQNVDLLSSLAGIAEKKGRYLLIDGYVALVLERIKAFALKAGITLKIPGFEKEFVKIVDNYTMQSVRKHKEYADSVGKIEKKIVSWDWVNANINRLIIPVRTYSQEWIGKNIKHFDNAMFIYSMWEGYQEGAEFAKTINYFKKLNIPQKNIHVSGHAYMSTIRKLVKSKSPRCIIPIHTEKPEIFVSEFGDSVHSMKNGETYEF